MEVSIVIINYNTYTLTCNCIVSVLQFTKDVKYEIILVDNASSEEEPTAFEELFPEVKVIRLSQNLGFAKGNNAGLELASGKYALLLNSDTLLKENSIKITFDYLERHPKVGVVSARLVYPNGKHQSVAQRFPSIKYLLTELLRLQKILPKSIRGKFLLGAFFDHKRNAVVDWIWGAYFMFRMSILQELGDKKLDDTFFMYMEDMQWCKDITKLGYQIHFCAETEVIHLMGGSSGPKSALMKENYNIFLKNNYSFMHILLINKINEYLRK